VAVVSTLSYRDEVVAGRYRVRLVYSGGQLLGAIVEIPGRGSYYIPRWGDVEVPRLPKKVKRHLARLGFHLPS
jgi:hypothetical protein